MCVAKWGKDDGVRLTNNDILHAGDLPGRGGRASRWSPRRQRQGQRRRPRARLVQRGDHGIRPGRQRRQARRTRRQPCFSWGTYDHDDTFADFSNYGTDVDLIAPGKCIWSTIPGNRYGYSSGTSMAAPHVTGAAALYQATRPRPTRPRPRPRSSTSATLDWRRRPTPTRPTRSCSTSRGSGPPATSGSPWAAPTAWEKGGTVSFPVTASAHADVLRAGPPQRRGRAGRARITVHRRACYGFDRESATITVTVPSGRRPALPRHGHRHGAGLTRPRRRRSSSRATRPRRSPPSSTP